MSIVGFVRERVFEEDAAFEQDHPRDKSGRFIKKGAGVAIQPSLPGFEKKIPLTSLLVGYTRRHNAISNVPLSSDFDAVEDDISAARNADLEESAKHLPADAFPADNAPLDEFADFPENYRNDVLEGVDAYTQQSELSIQIFRRSFEQVLADGEFLNQHDTYTSEGYLDPPMRAEAEDRFFGVGIDARPDDYPIYGHFEVPVEERDRFDEQLHQGVGNHYGAIQVVLKPEVKDRTTYTLGDSLDSNGRILPIPVGMLSSAAMPERLATRAHDTYEVVKDPFALREMLGQYVEAQIHGGVSIDDVEVVRFSHFGSVSRMPPGLETDWGAGRDYIFEVLQNKEIPFEYYEAGYEGSVRDTPERMAEANERLDYLRDTYGMEITRRPGE